MCQPDGAGGRHATAKAWTRLCAGLYALRPGQRRTHYRRVRRDPTSETRMIGNLIEQSERVAPAALRELLLDAGYFDDAVIAATLSHDVSLLCRLGPVPQTRRKTYSTKASSPTTPSKMSITAQRGNSFSASVIHKSRHARVSRQPMPVASARPIRNVPLMPARAKGAGSGVIRKTRRA